MANHDISQPSEAGGENDTLGRRIVARNADGAELTAAELEALSNAKGALQFLNRIRIDLKSREDSAFTDPEGALVSTVGPVDTLKEEAGIPSLVAIAESFGRFEIIESVGQGGFARVFRAYDPVLERQVALKIPKIHALVSEESAKRFRREARAAAMLSHPAIVPVFEAGEMGPISFIASEFCEGETLAAWFQREDRASHPKLAASIAYRLAEAVQHAHQRGVIHRDLKPANVLLDNSDSNTPLNERVRITDFGLARQMDSPEELITTEGAVVGTPAYMSPEQARGERNVGKAADIYSLGVILFELLAGQLPFQKSTYLETLRAVECEPAPILCRLDRSIPRDLSAICQKCLNKSPSDRYLTAYDLAEDLNAWLEGRSVKARPVSVARRLYQWFRRNTALGLALAFAFTSLFLGLGISLWQWNAANTNAARADAQLVETTKSKQQSENRRLQIENFSRSLIGMFEDLNLKRIGHSGQPLHEVMAHRVIAVGRKLETGMIDDPLVEADLKHSLAQSLIALGFGDEAVTFAKSALEIRRKVLTEEDLLTAASMSCLGEAYRLAGRYPEALDQHQLSRQIFSRILTENHPATLAVTDQVAVDLQLLGRFDDAVELFQLVLSKKLLELDERDPAVLTSMNNLASGFMANGQYELAEPIYEQTLKFREEFLNDDDYDLLTSMDQLARCYLAGGKQAEALPLFREALKRRIGAFGETHYATLVSLSGMASWYRADGQFEEALKLFKQVFEARKMRLGDSHELTYSSMHDLSAIYYQLKRFDEAKPLFEAAYEGFKSQLNREHPKCIHAMQSLATIEYQEGNFDRSTALLKQAAELATEKLSASHPIYRESLRKLARSLLNVGRYEAAIGPHQKLVEALMESHGANDLQTLNANAELGACYLWARNYEAAIDSLELIVAADKRIADFDYYRRLLRSAYARSGRLDKFQPMADADLVRYRETLEPNSEIRRSRLSNLGLDCLQAKNFEMAKPLLAEAIAILELTNADGYRLPNLRTMLGEAIMETGEPEAARPFLETGYEVLKQHEKSIHPLTRADNMIEAAERLLRFYQEVAEPANVKKMEAELRQLKEKYDR